MLFTPVGEANYSKDTVRGYHRPGDGVLADEPPFTAGHFSYVRRTGTGPDGQSYDMVGGMNYVCPGCKTVGYLPFRKPSLWPKQVNDWHWDGNRDVPTLTPSIHHVGCWHGHLTKGVFKSC